MNDGDVARRADLAERLSRVQGRIAQASRTAGRTETPQLIVVTKFFPAADVRHLAALGVREVGENRDQEAAAKAADTADLGLTWHFIGQLQTNKAKSVARYAAAVHSVDRAQLVSALGKAVRAERERAVAASETPREAMTALVQVDLRSVAQREAAGGGRGGALPEDVMTLAAAVEGEEGLTLGGLMAVAPLEADPAEAFAALRDVADELQRQYPHAQMISAGMSQDLEAAVSAGATHLRIGSDVLGPRPAVR
ncbi:YggS family pyridoxal phosphate-dependent enzyme [Zhihengliuella flava]|uniref:Pyridoxal phosphate homeostasis protein n=1 Tax=Zhihengliuella flava TaxID=1285193 RepID=A0A931GFR3_9MICC|nr:YggS family pyridoxal phosphate-dependent enzyme [Zhihengliuella flava]MBG6085638.1 pyridoxal phosphate enzyme (YggS family) [Zhihengliuella flava]